MRKYKGVFLGLTLLSVSLVAAPIIQPEAAYAASATTPTPTAAAGGSPVQVWLTDVGADQWLVKQNDVSFQTQPETNPLTIDVNDKVKYQKITGFGAALTDSAAYLINGLPAADRNTLMKNLFSSTSGAGLSMVRSPMGATDFTATGNTLKYKFANGFPVEATINGDGTFTTNYGYVYKKAD